MNCTHENGWRRPFDVRDDRAVFATFAADFAGGSPTTQRLAFKRIRVRLVGRE
jgi:hypothetical protein